MRNGLAALILFLAGALPASALQVSPQFFSFHGVPGSKIKSELILTNDGGDAANIRLEFTPVTVKPKGWFKLSETEVSLKPGESRKIEVTCRVPRKKGELAGNLLIICSGDSAWFEIRFNNSVYLRIQGTEVFRARFSDISAKREGDSLLIEATLQNTGNVRIKPKLTAELDLGQIENPGQIFDAALEDLMPGNSANFSTRMPFGRDRQAARTGIISAFFYNAEGKVEKISQDFKVTQP